jgi:hypothetical protein
MDVPEHLETGAERQRQNHPGTDRTVARRLKRAGDRLQANCKTPEGSSPPDRHAQLESIRQQVQAFQKQGQSVVPVALFQLHRFG